MWLRQQQQQHLSTTATRSMLLGGGAGSGSPLLRHQGGSCLRPNKLCAPSASLHQQRFLSSSSDDSYPTHILFPMPALSPTMESGSIASWTLKEGDAFIAGDVLCSIETDKASVDFEAQDDGVLAKILVPPGQDVAIGTPICVVTEEVDDVAAFADYKVAESAEQQRQQ